MNDTAPPGGTSGTSSTQSPPPPYSGEGPRPTRDEIRDLARLRRSTTDRKIAGVAGGIARHLDIDPVVVRIALVVLVFFGGGGILLYGAAWLLVPDDRGDSVVRLDDRSRTVALAIVGLLAALSLVGDAFGGWNFPWPLAVAGIVVVVLLGTGKGKKMHEHAMKHGWHGHGWHGHGWYGPQRMQGWHGAPGDERLVGEDGQPLPDDDRAPYGGAPGHPGHQASWQAPARDGRKKGPLLFGFALGLAALVVGIVGTVDLAGVDVVPSAYPASVLAVLGLMLLVGAFYGRAGGLTFLGLAAALVTAVTSVTSTFDAGEVRTAPTSAAAVADEYRLDVGELELDLTGIDDLDALDGRTIDLDLRVGRIAVVVPEDGLYVEVDATIEGVGEVKVFGDKSSNTLATHHDGGSGAPRLTIDATNYVGDIDIQTEGSTR